MTNVRNTKPTPRARVGVAGWWVSGTRLRVGVAIFFCTYISNEYNRHTSIVIVPQAGRELIIRDIPGE